MIRIPSIRTALCAMILLIAGRAVAQTPNAAPSIHPLTFVQTAAACVNRDSANTPAEWFPLLQRAQLWSLIYGASVAEAFGKRPFDKPATCAADMKRLAAELPKAEVNVFASNWRKARTNPSASAFFRLDPAYAASWCISVARDLDETARNAAHSIGLDSKSEQGRAQIATLLTELEGIVLVMGDWERTSKWTQATKGKPLDYTFLSKHAGYDYDFYWLGRKNYPEDETEKVVLRAAKIAFAGEGGQQQSSVLVNRLRLNVELGACREAARRIMIEE